MKRLVAPNGAAITGTLEKILGEAKVGGDVTRNPDGTYEIDYLGETEVDWDSQTTVERGGEIVFIDDNGDEWTGNQLVEAKDEGDDE